jgi:hypothetical protein
VTRGGFVEHFRLDANGEVDASRNDALQRKLAKNPSGKAAAHKNRTAQRSLGRVDGFDQDEAESKRDGHGAARLPQCSTTTGHHGYVPITRLPNSVEE